MGFFSAVKKFFGQKSQDEAEQKIQSGEAHPEESTAPAANQVEPGSPIPVTTEPEIGEAGPSAQAVDAECLPEKNAEGMASGELEVTQVELPQENIATAPEKFDLNNLGAQKAEVCPETAENSDPGQSVDLMATEATLEETPREEALSGDLEHEPAARETERIPEPGTKIDAEQAQNPDLLEPEQISDAEESGEEQDAEIAASSAHGQSPEEAELIKRLREAEPRLSQWLDIVLEGQETVSDQFWSRLQFLLRSLDAPDAEAQVFLDDFRQWLTRMDYIYVDEFRSELQYRLALALDLEDEEDERNRLLLKLTQGLAATREKLSAGLNALFSGHGELNDAFWEELEEIFIMADLGYETALEIVSRLKRRAAKENILAASEVADLLRGELEDIFRVEPKIRAVNKPEVVLMMGVNGAGKTTTIGKLAHRERMAGKKVLIAAADTFRAAAIEQLQVWSERAGADFYSRPAGSDPASVAYGAMDYALEHGIDVVFVDTAGRLQTRVNLMEELGKIRQVLAKKHPGAPHRSVLVLDATTGQNALSQAKLFREAAGADELILTKLDGTAKGGVAIAVAMQEKLPITFVGLGEKMDDLRPFHGADFARALLDLGQCDAQ